MILAQGTATNSWLLCIPPECHLTSNRNYNKLIKIRCAWQPISFFNYYYLRMFFKLILLLFHNNPGAGWKKVA